MALIPTTAAPVDYRRKIAMELMQQGMDGAPVRHWAQGLAKLGQGALGGYEMYQADQKDKSDDIEGARAYMALLQNTPGATPAASAPAPTPAPVPPASSAVPMAAPMGNKVVDALAPPPVTGPRPNGPVMPSAKVWGDAEAEAAGLYEPAAPNTKVASANPTAPIPAAAPAAPSPVTQALAQAPQAAPAPQAVAQAEDPNRAKIVQLLSSDSPAARKMGKALADNYIASQMVPKSTDEIREFEYNLKNPKFGEYKAGLKKAGATQVNVDTKGENAFATKAGQLQAARYDELASDAQSSKQMLSDVATLNELGKNINTGKLAEAKAAIGPYAQALGIDVKGLSEIQAFEAIVNRVAPSLRVKGSGAQSDYELKNFLKSLPSLGNTPEGNEIATKTMEGLYQNKLAAAEIGSKALSREITPAQADKMLRELPDHMQSYREYLKKNTAASKPGGGADRSAVEAEMRRRGLLK
jgi:hypothetical protein